MTAPEVEKLVAALLTKLYEDAVRLDVLLGKGFFEHYHERLAEFCEDTGWNLLKAACLLCAEDGLWEHLRALEAFNATEMPRR